MSDSSLSTRSLPRLGWLLLAAIALVWGCNWAAIKLALAEIPVWQHRAITCGLAGVSLLAIAGVTGQRLRVPRAAWGPLLLATAFNVTGWQITSAYGVRLIASGEASVLAFTMPVWATFLSAVFLHERLTARTLIALALALGGILDLLWPALGALGSAPLGMALMIGSAISWASGTTVQKRVRWPLSPIGLAGWQLVIGTIPMILVAIATEPFALTHASVTALGGLAYTYALAMTFGQYAWFKVVSLFPATIASISVTAVPVVSMIVGAAVLGEPLGWREFIALACVTSAIVLIVTPSRGARATPSATKP